MKTHPNALLGGLGGGIVGGQVVVEILDACGVHVSANLGAFLAGVVATVVLAVGRKGVEPSLERLWRGPRSR